MTTIRGSACMERDKSIDAVAGMMIIVMVVGHCVAEGYLKTFINVLNFFMPWFYYKSGMFYRVQSNLECIIGGGQEITSSLHQIHIFRLDSSIYTDGFKR